MAIDQTQHIQLACKIVDLRRLRSPPQTKVGRLEGAVDDKQVDSRVQMVNIKSWGEKKEKANQLEQQLRVHHREATILASLSHVSGRYGHSQCCAKLTCSKAEHHRH